MTVADGTRRLKAIMFTDIKGYSAMMGADEQRTVKLVLEHREIVRECLKAHDGSEHETIGDAFVVLFDSVVNAVRCGTEIQQRLRERNAALPLEEQVWLRIGIHLGDIIVQGDGIYGDGVNVAARVQDKADPGGINITEQVYLQIDGKVDVAMEPLGKVELKNIRNPPSMYRLRLDGTAAAPSPNRRVTWAVAAGVAVLGAAALVAWRWPDAPPPEAPPAVAAPRAIEPTLPAESAAAADRKSEAARKFAQAIGATGQARIDLLREALALDPHNTAVQNLLASSVVAPAAMPSPSAADATAPAANGAPAPAGGNRGPSNAKPKSNPTAPGIRPTIIGD
jgi:class 3 adenylate cyclase